ncbi:shikimate dehydrogenase family protein [Robertkochia solimangrovi]|uniref:shikimate dehydrogenase family protein n=1 Tax=Robertkochia solimangrovi TaxID=2213046 RepID=UPI00117D074F|nr:shikimate dehydrogenase [Robertkochia solimangrovi]TRZ43614.1 shikimate dehydrogenase [Robertkochia solimangrovi]
MSKLFGLVGKNIAYSFSRRYFTDKFEIMELGDHSYVNFDIPTIEDFPEIHKKHQDLIGMNVTIPYKQAVIPYLNDLDEIAKEIGAVNTIKVTGNKLTGYNTDAVGFDGALTPALHSGVKKALILGTGGASKAVAWVLNQKGIDYQYVSRTPATGRLTYEELKTKGLETFDLLVNCTPLGTFPNVELCPDLPYDTLSDKHILFDLIYNPEQTAFMKKGAEKGAKTLNGYRMLELQAEKAWEIWNR